MTARGGGPSRAAGGGSGTMGAMAAAGILRAGSPWGEVSAHLAVTPDCWHLSAPCQEQRGFLLPPLPRASLILAPSHWLQCLCPTIRLLLPCGDAGVPSLPGAPQALLGTSATHLCGPLPSLLLTCLYLPTVFFLPTIFLPLTSR